MDLDAEGCLNIKCEPEVSYKNGWDFEQFNIKIENGDINSKNSEDTLRCSNIKRELEDGEPDSLPTNNGSRKIQRLHSVSDEVDPLSLDDFKSSEAFHERLSPSTLFSDYSKSLLLQSRVQIEKGEGDLDYSFHFMPSSNVIRYRCKLCKNRNYTTKNKKYIESHVKVCEMVQGALNKKSFEVKSKVKYGHEDSLECPILSCPKKFHLESELEVHTSSWHNLHRAPSVPCSFSKCDESFTFKSERTAHMKQVHNFAKVHEPKPRETKEKSKVRYEQKDHLECPIVSCTKKFYLESELDVHINSHNLHSTKRVSVPCSFPNCDESFTYKLERIAHMKQAHNFVPPVKVHVAEHQETKKKVIFIYRCHLCHFSSEDVAEVHSHTRQKHQHQQRTDLTGKPPKIKEECVASAGALYK